MNIIQKINNKINNLKFIKNHNSSVDYWESRYQKGGNSGNGSYGDLAIFKAKVLNDFVKKNDIKSVIEFGCGDGNQLTLCNYPKYIGLDVSRRAVELCEKKFKGDKIRSFFLYHPSAFMDNHKLFNCDLSLSLDVVYHLLEDDIYQGYMRHLFDSANKFVIIYSCDDEDEGLTSPHVRFRKFSKWIEDNIIGWILVEKIPNIYKNSKADFYIYKK